MLGAAAALAALGLAMWGAELAGEVFEVFCAPGIGRFYFWGGLALIVCGRALELIERAIHG